MQTFFKDDEKALKGLREGLLSMGIVMGVIISFLNPYLGNDGFLFLTGVLGAEGLIANTVPGTLMPIINNELVSLSWACFAPW